MWGKQLGQMKLLKTLKGKAGEFMSIGDFEKLSQIPGNVVGHCTSQGPQRNRTNRRYIERDRFIVKHWLRG